jgi:creatinine amidohydrolase
MPLPSRRWEDLSWTDFAALDPGTIAILPVAAIEQHGPHLPVSVDADLNLGILARALALAPPALPLIVLPIQKIGLSIEHGRFPGTLTLRPETLLALWTEIAEGVVRAGIRKLVVFNSHGGQPQLVDILCQRLRSTHGMLAVGASWFRLVRAPDGEAALPEAERRLGIHGGAVETAMMMHLAPDAVRRAEIRDFSSPWAQAPGAAQLSPVGPIGFGWETQDLHPSGAVGDARLASPELGAGIVEGAARALVGLLEEVHRFDLSALLREGPSAGVGHG